MRKLFKKITILMLTLALLLAVSASVFAVETWSDFWTAGDDTTVEYYATISAARTLGTIDSQCSGGEVYVEVDASYTFDGTNWSYTHRYDNGYEYAGVSVPYGGNAVRATATYYFNAYVDTTGEEFSSDTISLCLD